MIGRNYNDQPDQVLTALKDLSARPDPWVIRCGPPDCLSIALTNGLQLTIPFLALTSDRAVPRAGLRWLWMNDLQIGIGEPPSAEPHECGIATR